MEMCSLNVLEAKSLPRAVPASEGPEEGLPSPSQLLVALGMPRLTVAACTLLCVHVAFCVSLVFFSFLLTEHRPLYLEPMINSGSSLLKSLRLITLQWPCFRIRSGLTCSGVKLGHIFWGEHSSRYYSIMLENAVYWWMENCSCVFCPVLLYLNHVEFVLI